MNNWINTYSINFVSKFDRVKFYSFFVAFTLWSMALNAQVVCVPTGDEGSAYPAFVAASFGIESPDCEHTSFGPHVTQEYDSILDRNVFVFHSHITLDNDRCQVFDRVRMEVKGGPNTSLELQHPENSVSYYRWKFFLDEEFVGASSFNHIFQNKAKGGNDDSFPVLTFTARQTALELSHNGGDTGSNLGILAVVSLEEIKGKWIEAYMMQRHGENGALEVNLKDMSTGLTLLEYSNNDIDLWRTGAEYNRPKWGMYRSKNSSLKDEQIRFSDFCISEEDSALCPGEAVLIVDIDAPSAPTNLEVKAVSITTIDLAWDPSDDVFGVTGYDVVQDGLIVDSTTNTFASIENLSPGTEYTFAIQAKDLAGNISVESNAVIVSTDPEDALPSVASNPFPEDESTNINTTSVLSWLPGSNTDSYNVYFGEDVNPPLVANQLSNEFQATLSEFVNYYWRVEAINANGVITSPIWTFETGSSNPDFPWQVYRANQRPELETNFFDLNEAPVSPTVDEIVDDPNGSSNTYFSFRSNTDEKFRWRHEFTPTDSVITIVARLQALSSDVNSICHFEVRGNGWRQKVRINQSTIKLEKSTPVVELDLPFNIVNEMHLLRMVSDGQSTSIYLDENPIPFATAQSDTPSTDTNFEWGKSGGADYGATMDWIVIDKTGGYTPGQGTILPEDLFLNSIATLSSIELDGMPLAGFSPSVLEYDIELDNNTVPEVSWTTSSILSSADAENPTSTQDTKTVIQVTAQDGFTMKEYIINYNPTTRIDNQFNTREIKLFPNPANEMITVKIEGDQSGVGTIYSKDGIRVKENIFINGEIMIDVANLPSGIYYFSFKESEGLISNQIFKIK